MFPFTQHYWSTYIAYINDASLWIAFIPCLILWIYYYKAGKYVHPYLFHCHLACLLRFCSGLSGNDAIHYPTHTSTTDAMLWGNLQIETIRCELCNLTSA